MLLCDVGILQKLILENGEAEDGVGVVGGWGFRGLHGGEGDAKFILNLSLIVLLVGVLQGLIRIYPPDTRALTVVRIDEGWCTSTDMAQTERESLPAQINIY